MCGGEGGVDTGRETMMGDISRKRYSEKQCFLSTSQFMHILKKGIALV